MAKPLLKYLIFLLVSLFCVRAHAQLRKYEGDQHVFGAAGGSLKTDKHIIDWTIGEPIVELRRGSKKQLSQGFHQSKLLFKSTYIFSMLDQEKFTHFSVFPNPFVANFTVEWNFSEDLNLIFEVFSLDGQRIFYKRQNARDLQLQIQLLNLKPSIYILRISDPLRNFSESHKIVKN
jgi:hypothetical protein